MPAWPGRHLLEGGEDRRYFALKTVSRGVVEFECSNQREHNIWTQGVSSLLVLADEKNNKNRLQNEYKKKARIANSYISRMLWSSDSSLGF